MHKRSKPYELKSRKREILWWTAVTGLSKQFQSRLVSIALLPLVSEDWDRLVLLLGNIGDGLRPLGGRCHHDRVLIAFVRAVGSGMIVDVAFLGDIGTDDSFEFGKLSFVDFHFVYQPAWRRRLTCAVVVNVAIPVIDVGEWKARHAEAFVQIRVLFGQRDFYELYIGGKFLGQSMIAAFNCFAGFAPGSIETDYH